jgi:predicted enzyme related to lactoylglutathione lyase
MKITAHPPGTFCFAELQTPDIEASARFYQQLFGWAVAASPGGADSLLFRLEDKDVAALRHAVRGPHRWVPYLAVEHAAAAAARAQELGAVILSAPHALQGLAHVCVVRDPAGGVVGLWEPKGHQGARVLDEPGSMWWAELLTREVAVAKKFYANLLGWRAVDTLKYGIRYSVFKRGDESLAGLLPIGADWGPLAPRWQILFAVADCDAAVARATSLGATVVFGPNDIPNAGRGAVIADPLDGIVVLMQPTAGHR